MPVYVETCPLGRTNKEITFTIEGDRQPSPTKGCICAGTSQEQNLRQAAVVASVANLSNALFDSILSGGKPVEYRSFEVKGIHTSKIVKVVEIPPARWYKIL